jgi:hypothetical protein
MAVVVRPKRGRAAWGPTKQGIIICMACPLPRHAWIRIV